MTLFTFTVGTAGPKRTTTGELARVLSFLGTSHNAPTGGNPN